MRHGEQPGARLDESLQAPVDPAEVSVHEVVSLAKAVPHWQARMVVGEADAQCGLEDIANVAGATVGRQVGLGLLDEEEH